MCLSAISLQAANRSVFMARTVVICHSDGLAHFAVSFTEILNDARWIWVKPICAASWLAYRSIQSVMCIKNAYLLVIHRFRIIFNIQISFKHMLDSINTSLSSISQSEVFILIIQQIPQRLHNADLYSSSRFISSASFPHLRVFFSFLFQNHWCLEVFSSFGWIVQRIYSSHLNIQSL